MLGAEVAVDVEVVDVEAGEQRRTCDEPGEESFLLLGKTMSLAGRFGVKRRSEGKKKKNNDAATITWLYLVYLLRPTHDDATVDADLESQEDRRGRDKARQPYK